MTEIYCKLVEKLLGKGLHIATAESLTGGLVACSVVDVPGASGTMTGGFVTYCDEAKHNMLGVSEETLRKFGAISEETAAEMAAGAAEKTGADIAVSTTGNAGPDAAEGKPVGLAYIGIYLSGKTAVYECRLEGGRNEIRRQVAALAGRHCLELLENEIQ